jgi:hypothetical protein
MLFDYGRCDRKLLYAAYKDWTGMGGTKFPLKHKAFAKRLRSRDVGDGGKAGKQPFLVEDSPARRRLLTVRHRHAPASRRSCRGQVGQETRDYPKLFLLTVSREKFGEYSIYLP